MRKAILHDAFHKPNKYAVLLCRFWRDWWSNYLPGEIGPQPTRRPNTACEFIGWRGSGDLWSFMILAINFSAESAALIAGGGRSSLRRRRPQSGLEMKGETMIAALVLCLAVSPVARCQWEYEEPLLYDTFPDDFMWGGKIEDSHCTPSFCALHTNASSFSGHLGVSGRGQVRSHIC